MKSYKTPSIDIDFKQLIPPVQVYIFLWKGCSTDIFS